jgi:hypothetical protein
MPTPGPKEIRESFELVDWLQKHLKTVGVVLFIVSCVVAVALWFFATEIPRWLFIVAVLVMVALAALLLFSFGASVLERVRKWDKLKRHLANDEQFCLRRFIETNQMNCCFLGNEAGPGSLLEAGILRVDAGVGELARTADRPAFWYTIDPWVFNYLKKHSEVVGLNHGKQAH